MKSEELELDILKRQNREMAIKMQVYRLENQQIKAKNQELNQWVGNLSEVFSILSASWESITILEQTLLTLMKKKTDVKDKTILRKYQFHFKTFADIINNLSDKIKNAGHSDQASQDAKEQLRSFVKNYQLIFKQFIETYFKFNQEYTQYLTDLKNREDIKGQLRDIMAKSLEGTQRIKQFEGFTQSLKQKFQMFQQFNNQKLLQGVVKKKQQQIQALKQRNDILQRRIKIVFDYCNASINMQISAQDKDFQCLCGGAQLSYLKKCWQQKLSTQCDQKNPSLQPNPTHPESLQLLQSKLAAIQQQKQNLITRNGLLLQKISKMNTQFKLTQEMVLKSNVYAILKGQCQQLLGYITELLNKLKKQQEFIFVIERSREEEIKELKRRYERNRQEDKVNVNSNYNSNSNGNNFGNPIEIFKTQVIGLTKQLIKFYQESNQKFTKSQDVLRQFKNQFQILRKSNQEMNKKINDLQSKQLSKTDGFQFKHQKFKEIQTSVQALVEKNLPNLQQLWKQFIFYVKGRDKKIKDLQATLRKKDKQIAQKNSISELMKGSLDQTQRYFLASKQKLDKTESFIKKYQTQLLRLSQQNLQIQSQSHQDKHLLTLRLKAETEARNKLQQKLSILSKIQHQLAQLSTHSQSLLSQTQSHLSSSSASLSASHSHSSQLQLQLSHLTQQSQSQSRLISKLQSQKESLQSSLRQHKNQIEIIRSSNQNDILKMELEEYKGKIMCSCTGDREREVVLKTCPHLFCKRCIEDTTNNRNRKCPLCGIRFTKTDIHEIKWN